MKYIFMGTIAPEWIGRQTERLQSCKVKADELGMSFDAIYYTQGIYDFVDVVEASDTNPYPSFPTSSASTPAPAFWPRIFGPGSSKWQRYRGSWLLYRGPRRGTI